MSSNEQLVKDLNVQAEKSGFDSIDVQRVTEKTEFGGNGPAVVKVDVSA